MSKRHVRSPIAWLGGKGRMRAKLLPLFPPHNHYVEPFGGGASLLLAKGPCAGLETYNDLDAGLVGLFRVLADEAQFGRFYRRVVLLPHSRAIYSECLATWAEQEDPIERAARWFVVARQSFGGQWGASWGMSVANDRGGGSPKGWQSILNHLPIVHARLQGVQVECQDFRTVLDCYQGPGYLTYCDPPYVQSTRSKTFYTHEMSDQDHADLVRLLLKYRGAVVLTGYRSELYAPLEGAGWERRDFRVCCHVAGRTRATGLKGKGKVSATQQRTESVWRNPECLRRIKEGTPE